MQNIQPNIAQFINEAKQIYVIKNHIYFAFMLKIIDNDLCTFCNENKESIEHLLWECNIVQTFFELIIKRKQLFY